jgi:hypothetical protein
MPSNIVDSPIYVPGAGDGQPGNFTLPGSGTAVPAGLEAVLEYNGLLMNIRKNVDTYRILSIDGLADADIRDTRDVNTADDGETPYNSFYGGRTISISGTIVAYSVAKMRDMQQALRAAFADIRNEYALQFRTGDFTKDHIIYCKKVSSIAGTEQQQNFQATRDFQVTLRASNPRFLSFYQKFIDEFPPKPTLNPLQISNAENIGTYTAQPIFRIYGPSTNATITNDTTQESFSIGTIPFADYLEFDTANRTLKNSLGVNSWNLLADDSDYMGFVPGDNPIFYSGDVNRIQIWWRDSWI